jgi:hypothetical protein
LGATAQTAINLTGGARDSLATGERCADIVVRKHVTGADDHRWPAQQHWYQLQLSYLRPAKFDFNQKSVVFSYSKLLVGIFGRPHRCFHGVPVERVLGNEQGGDRDD